jgi:hypothetical protein
MSTVQNVTPTPEICSGADHRRHRRRQPAREQNGGDLLLPDKRSSQ